MPSRERWQDKLEGKPFKLLAVNMGESQKQIEKFLGHTPLDMTILLDPNGVALRDWRVFAVPSSYIIDKQGRVTHAYTGALEWDEDEVVELIGRLTD
jgi:predicted transcriptional regulator